MTLVWGLVIGQTRSLGVILKIDPKGSYLFQLLKISHYTAVYCGQRDYIIKGIFR